MSFWQTFWNNLQINIGSLYDLYSAEIVSNLIIVLIGLIVIILSSIAFSHFLRQIKVDKTYRGFIGNLFNIFMVLILLAIILSRLGVNVSGLMAGLGIAGIIIGLALKDPLANLASGFFILFSRPFKRDDYIEISGIKGKVRSLGLAACKIDTSDNKKIIIPNNIIWNNPIINYTARGKRKIEIIVSISYSNNIDKAMKVVHNIFKKEKRILDEPEPKVVVDQLADSGVNLLVMPWVMVEDYKQTKFDLNKKIKEEFDKNKITIPFPQMDVHVKK